MKPPGKAPMVVALGGTLTLMATLPALLTDFWRWYDLPPLPTPTYVPGRTGNLHRDLYRHGPHWPQYPLNVILR